MTSIEAAMRTLAKNVSDFSTLFLEYQSRLDAEWEKRDQILEEKGDVEASNYDQAVLSPLMTETGQLRLNARYYALAALSLRRFVAGRLYLMVKARSITHVVTNPLDGFPFPI